MSVDPKQLKDFSAEVKAAVPGIVEEAYKEVRTRAYSLSILDRGCIFSPFSDM